MEKQRIVQRLFGHPLISIELSAPGWLRLPAQPIRSVLILLKMQGSCPDIDRTPFHAGLLL
jgi:hypothetical protein